MSLGQAFIDINANTDGFTAKLKALQTEIDALQAKANAALSGLSTKSGTTTGTGASPAVVAQESIAEASKAAADTQIADLERLKAARRAASDEEVAASRRASDADSAFRKAEFNSTLRAEQTLTDAEIANAKASLPALKAVADERAAQAEEARRVRRALDRQIDAETIASSRTVAEASVAAQESIAKASTASAETQIKNLERVEAAAAKAGIAPTAAPAAARAVTDTGAVDSTVATEKAKIAASNSAIAAINEEKAARRAQLAEAIAAGAEEVKALRAEIVEQDKVASAAVAAEKVRIAASRSAIAAINEETAALKLRNEAAGQTGPARAVSPVASLNNAAVKQQLADMAAVAKAGQKAIEDAAKNAPQFSPGSASGIAQFQAISDAAKKSVAERISFEKEFQASIKESYLTQQRAAQVAADAAKTSSTAWRTAYSEIVARAKEATAVQAEESRKAAAAAKTAAAETATANKTASNSFIGKSASSITDSIKGVPGDLFGAITTSAKFATIGVVGLGVALAAIGVVNAAKQQAAVVGFTALAAQISATTDATTGLTVATQGLSQAQAGAIGQDFENRLILLANNSALAQSAIQDTSQALLALGFNGDQALGIIRDIGNALAASGKTGGGLNDDLKGIVVAFSQIRGAGRLLAQDLNQITTRIPSVSRIQVYVELAKALKLANANAKEGTPAFNALLVEVQKLAKEGKIASDVAIPAIIKALKEVPGAAADAVTGLDALGRQNITLTGRFEALKDNVRSALAKAFLLPGEPGGPTGGKSLSERLADQIGAGIPAITSAIKRIGPSLSNFVSDLGGTLLKILPPLVALIGKVFAELGSVLSKINLTGLVDGLGQLGTKGTAAHGALSDLVTVLGDLYRIGVNLTPVAVGIAKGFAAAVNAIKPFLSILKTITSVIGSISGTGLGQSFIALGAIILASRIGIGLFVKAMNAAAASAAKAALAVKEFGTASIFAGNAAAGAAAKTEAGALAGGAATGGFTSKIKSLGNAALIIGPILIAAGEAGHALGEKITEGSRKAAQALQAAQENATKLAPAYTTLSQHVGDLGVSLDFLSQNLDAVGIQTLADSFTTGQFTDTISGLVNALESSGSTAAQVVTKLESLGVSATNAQGAVNGLPTAIAAANAELAALSTDEARAQLRALELQALAAAGAIRSVANNPFVSSTTGEVPGSLPFSNAASDQAILDTNAAAAASASAVSGALAGGASAASSAASSAADKIKTAKQTLIDSLKAFATDVTTETPKQIRSALNTIRKEFDKLGKLEGVSTGGLDKLLAKDSLALQKFSKELAKTTKDLADATARFDAVKSSIQDFASVGSIDLASIGLAAKDATTKLADLSKLRIIRPGQDALNIITGGSAIDLAKGAQRFADALKARLNQITEFQANVDKLIKEGLNRTTIDQIISQGPEQGGVLAQSLAGASKQTIDQINATQKGIDAAAKKLANTAVDSLFRSGQAVVSGLLQGLKDKEKEITAAMKHIADVLVAEIKKRLKIASPSQRMAAEVGAHIIPGIVAGFDHAPLRDAMAGVADTLASARLATPAVDASSLDLKLPELAPLTQSVVAKLDSGAIKFKPVTVDVLARMADIDARASLAPLPAVEPREVQLLAPPSSAQGLTAAQGDAMIGHLARIGRVAPDKRVYTPTPPPGRAAGPNTDVDALARAVRGLR